MTESKLTFRPEPAEEKESYRVYRDDFFLGTVRRVYPNTALQWRARVKWPTEEWHVTSDTVATRDRAGEELLRIHRTIRGLTT